MPMPTFPQIDPPLTRKGSLNEIIASIAAEELSLSHILNAQGEKLQYVLGTLPGMEKAAAFDELMKVNQSIQDTISGVMEQQMLLTGKLNAAMTALVLPGPTGPTGAIGPGLSAGFVANTRGESFKVVLGGGTVITMPDAQLLSPDITINSTNTVLTVGKEGLYQISYHVNITAPSLVGVRLLVNAFNSTASTVKPLVATSSYEGKIKIALLEHSTITLRLFGPVGETVTLVDGGAGASLSIIWLGDQRWKISCADTTITKCRVGECVTELYE